MRTIVLWSLAALSAAVLLAFAAPAQAFELTSPTGGEKVSASFDITWVRDSPTSEVEVKLYVSGEEIEPKLCENCPGESLGVDSTLYADSDEYFVVIEEKGDGDGPGSGKEKISSKGTFTIDNTPPETTAVLDGAMGESGFYTSDVLVTLVAEDATAGVASTTFSVDGGPEMTYSDTLRIGGNGVHTVDFYSTDEAGNSELTNTVSFEIDVDAPFPRASAIGILGDNEWHTGDVNVFLSSTFDDANVTEFWASVDGAPFALVGEAPFAMSGGGACNQDGCFTFGPFVHAPKITVSSEGDHLVRFFANDEAGRTSIINSIAFRIDSVAPTTQSVLAGETGDAGYYVGDVTVTFDASDATSGLADTLVSVDGGAFASYTDSIRITGDGTHTVDFYSTDMAGNVESTRSVSFDLDAGPPTTDVALSGTLGENDWYTGDVTVTLTGNSFPADLAHTWASVDDGVFESNTAPIVVSGDGDHTVRFYSEDTAGNVEAEDFVSFRIDSAVPETTGDINGHLGDNDWYVSEVTIGLSAEDATSGVADTLFDLNFAGDASYTGLITETADGIHRVDYHSVDVAGNVESTITRTFGIDRTDPVSTLTIGSPSDDHGRAVYITSDTELTLDATDATSGVDRIEYRLQDGAFVEYTGPITVSGEDGAYTLEWRAVDAAGNHEETQVQPFELDNTAPTLDMRRPQAGGLYLHDTVVVETLPVLVEAGDLSAGADDVNTNTIPFAVAVGNLTARTETVDAGSGVRDVVYSIDGIERATVTEAPYEWTWDTSDEILGWHTITSRTTDTLGNTQSTSLEVFVVMTALDGINATIDNGGPRLGSYEALVPTTPEPPVAVPEVPEPPVGVPDVPEAPTLPLTFETIDVWQDWMRRAA